MKNNRISQHKSKPELASAKATALPSISLGNVRISPTATPHIGTRPHSWSTHTQNELRDVNMRSTSAAGHVADKKHSTQNSLRKYKALEASLSATSRARANSLETVARIPPSIRSSTFSSERAVQSMNIMRPATSISDVRAIEAHGVVVGLLGSHTVYSRPQTPLLSHSLSSPSHSETRPPTPARISPSRSSRQSRTLSIMRPLVSKQSNELSNSHAADYNDASDRSQTCTDATTARSPSTTASTSQHCSRSNSIRSKGSLRKSDTADLNKTKKHLQKDLDSLRLYTTYLQSATGTVVSHSTISAVGRLKDIESKQPSLDNLPGGHFEDKESAGSENTQKSNNGAEVSSESTSESTVHCNNEAHCEESTAANTDNAATESTRQGSDEVQDSGSEERLHDTDRADYDKADKIDDITNDSKDDQHHTSSSDRNSMWLWGWFGGSNNANLHTLKDIDVHPKENTSSTADANMVRHNTSGPSKSSDSINISDSMNIDGDGADTSFITAGKEFQSINEPHPPDHTDSKKTNQLHTEGSKETQNLKNMVLPQLNFDDLFRRSSVFKRQLANEVEVPTPVQDRNGSYSTTDAIVGPPNAESQTTTIASLTKRLRTIGKYAYDTGIDIAPEWIRSKVKGRNLADKLGQSSIHTDEFLGGENPINSLQVQDMIEKGAEAFGNIAVIGVHGWFPTKMLQMVAGEPTGKSEKFCLMMRDALVSYLNESHGAAINADDIALYPLVGQGKIDDRVDILLSQITDSENYDESQSTSNSSNESIESGAEKLMPDKSERIARLKSADTIFVVTHSQGTPVSALLLERFIELGLIDTKRQRVCMLAMAGISHGPLPYLRSNVVIKYIESEAARELFELMDPSSPQSQRYVAALSTIMHKGVRLVCVGSWIDEVVPLYSAILHGVSHPNVYRAVYIDAHHYIDDFLTGLITFALRLRNMGIYDHGLLIYLSEVVAGSLWGHSGHSTIYSEPDVYKLAIKWLMYTALPIPTPSRLHGGVAFSNTRLVSDQDDEQIHMSYRPFNACESLNPFYIPWIMRSLWDEPEIKHNSFLRSELKRLVALYDKWKPETKVGKELKYRLEPVRDAM